MRQTERFPTVQVASRTQARHPAGNGVAVGVRPVQRARVVIADDHHLVRAGVKHSLARMSAGYELVGESTNAEDMVAAVSRTQPDALILDVVMRERPALDALAACMRLKADLAVVVLTARAELRLAREAIGIGALGYVLKDAEPSELLLALRLALRGASYLAPGLVNRLAQDGESSQPRALSQREREVVRLLALGHTFREIAAQMKFSERTVKSDRANVAQVLGISTRAELTCWALQHGLLSGAQAA